MKKVWLTFLLSTFTVSVTFSQMFYLIDSIEISKLMKELESATLTSRIDIQNEIASRVVNFEPEKFIKLYNEILKECEEGKYEKGKAFIFSNMGFYQFLQGNFNEALTSQLQALQLAEKYADSSLIMLIFERMGYIYYFSKTDEKQILNNYDTVFNYYNNKKMYNDAATRLLITGGGYYRIGQYQESFIRLNKYLEYTKNLTVPRFEKLIAFYSLGDINFIWGKNDEALNNYRKAIKFMDYNYMEEIALNANVFLRMGSLYLSQNMLDSAFIYIQKAYKLSESIYYTRGLMNSSLKFAAYYQKEGSTSNQILYYKMAFNYGQIIDSTGYFFNGMPYSKYVIDVTDESWMSSPKKFRSYFGKLGILESLKGLINLYGKINEPAKALKYVDKLLITKNEALAFENKKALMDLKLKYESVNKDQQIELLYQENELRHFQIVRTRYILFGLGAMIVLVILIAILINRQNKLKSNHQNLLLQQKLFRSQMNPHFLFNSMSSIQNYIIDEKPDKAAKYLSRFSKLMRNILDSSVEEFVPLEEEISTIENYLELQKIRYHNKFDYSIEIDNTIDKESIMIPPMLAQPFIENSIEHGFKSKESKGKIKIKFTTIGKFLHFEIEDDGIGRKKAQEIRLHQNEDYKSLATVISLERINVINRKMKSKITLTIEDLINEKGDANGTKVTFNIPYET